jgi:hypothetical protein
MSVKYIAMKPELPAASESKVNSGSSPGNCYRDRLFHAAHRLLHRNRLPAIAPSNFQK